MNQERIPKKKTFKEEKQSQISLFDYFKPVSKNEPAPVKKMVEANSFDKIANSLENLCKEKLTNPEYLDESNVIEFCDMSLELEEFKSTQLANLNFNKFISNDAKYNYSCFPYWSKSTFVEEPNELTFEKIFLKKKLKKVEDLIDIILTDKRSSCLATYKFLKTVDLNEENIWTILRKLEGFYGFSFLKDQIKTQDRPSVSKYEGLPTYPIANILKIFEKEAESSDQDNVIRLIFEICLQLRMDSKLNMFVVKTSEIMQSCYKTNKVNLEEIMNDYFLASGNEKLFISFVNAIADQDYDEIRPQLCLKYLSVTNKILTKRKRSIETSIIENTLIMLQEIEHINTFAQKNKKTDYIRYDSTMQIIEFMLHDSLIINNLQNHRNLKKVYQALVQKHSKIRDLTNTMVDINMSVAKDRLHNMFLRLDYIIKDSHFNKSDFY